MQKFKTKAAVSEALSELPRNQLSVKPSKMLWEKVKSEANIKLKEFFVVEANFYEGNVY